jgi:NADH:ubiquinone oxidoreductase subunit C
MWFLLSIILSKFIYGYLLKEINIMFFINKKHILLILTILKKSSFFLVSSLLDLVVIDKLKCLNVKRFSLYYIFWSYINEIRIILRFDSDLLQSNYSISSLYLSSDWLEREVWDLYGIKFLFHKNLRRILTDYKFKGHALRKDFPLIGYIEIWYDETIQGISINSVELAQMLRYYEFENPWNKWNK